MNLQDLRTMLDYHYWARDRMLEALDALSPDQLTRDLGSSFKSIHETIAQYVADSAVRSAAEAAPTTRVESTRRVQDSQARVNSVR